MSNFDVFYRWMFDAIGSFRADIGTLRSRPVVIGVGEKSDQGAERTARELARLLGQEPVVFVGEHLGFAEARSGSRPSSRRCSCERP